MGRLSVTPMLVGPMFQSDPATNLAETNGSSCNRIVAVVGPIVAHNGEFLWSYLFV